jgi:methionine synthase II (cobalamin-independent)
MAVQQNTDHIQTTHIGSLPRPHKLLDILKAKYGSQPYDEVELNSTLAQAVADCVRKQVECGVEIVTDGEYSKPGFFTYIRERFDGFEARPNQKLFVEPGLDDKQKKRRAETYVEATNAALSGIAAERVRFHTCYGINEGPRIHESNLPEIVEYVLKINAGSFSFEAANPRHEHEYHLFERVKLPEGKVLCPGVITHASNIVEHPEWIAERLIRFAKLVGRENVMAGADCGFSSQALYKTEVHPTVVWEKFKAMREGADLATKRLWN